MSGARRRRASHVPLRAALLAALAAALPAPACSSCPPDWADAPPEAAGFVYGVGTAGELAIDTRPADLALTRAARVVADALALDVESRLAVRYVDDRLFVDAWSPAGQLTRLDELELVDLAVCDGRTFALVRLPVE